MLFFFQTFFPFLFFRVRFFISVDSVLDSADTLRCSAGALGPGTVAASCVVADYSVVFVVHLSYEVPGHFQRLW